MNPLHDSEQVIGRLTKTGRLDRRYRAVEPLPPFKDDPLRTTIEVLVGTIVMLLLFVGLLLWVAVGTVAQT